MADRRVEQKQKQRVVVGTTPCVGVVNYYQVAFDTSGFQYPGEESSKVLWRRVVRVAVGYEIHPIAIVDWDFIAFQGSGREITYWVYTDFTDAFCAEVRRRFGWPEIPAMEDWADSRFCIRAYTIWPAEEIGRPMYKTVKRHWWSWRARLAYTDMGQDAHASS